MKSSAKLTVVFVVLVVSALAAWHATARDEVNTPKSAPLVVLGGLEEYKTNGVEAAIRAWVKGSTLLEQESFIRNTIDSYKKIETTLGSYQSYEVVQVQPLSRSTRIVYVVMNYEHGPLFVRFLCYQTGSSEVVCSFPSQFDPERIFPSSLLATAK